MDKDAMIASLQRVSRQKTRLIEKLEGDARRLREERDEVKRRLRSLIADIKELERDASAKG